MVSPTECAASDSMAALPVSSPATSFATPTARFAPIASSTVSVLSPPDFATEDGVPAIGVAHHTSSRWRRRRGEEALHDLERRGDGLVAAADQVGHEGRPAGLVR